MRLRWIAAPAVVALILVMIPFGGEEPTPTQTSVGTTTTTTTTTTSTLPPPPVHQTPATTPVTFAPIPIPGAPELACGYIHNLPGDRYLDRAVDFCLPIAWALWDLMSYPGDKVGAPSVGEGFDFTLYRRDVLHAIYVMSGESGADPNANAINWGCPANTELRPEDSSLCRAYGARVPISWYSHMSHLVQDRSDRLLGYQIDPYSLYESSLLAFALVYEIGGNGWFHWWHIAWGMNAYTSRHGITPTWYCPPDAYWANVRGGRQECPTG